MFLPSAVFTDVHPKYKSSIRGFREWLFLGASLIAPTVQADYTITDLGTLGGSASYAYDINNAGQVVGWSWTAGNTAQRAFLYSGGVMTDLGTLGGPGSDAYGINDGGHVVGNAQPTPGNWAGYRYSGGVMSDLSPLSRVFGGINNKGQIAGDRDSHAFLYDGGVMTDLGALGSSGYSSASGINDSGQVVGSSGTTPAGGFHAFLWISGSGMQDLGTLGGTESFANDINNDGWVVGASKITGDVTNQAFLYSGGVMTNIGSLGGSSSAVGINNIGQIVGSSRVSPGESHAFLYSDGIMYDLNVLVDPTSGWLLSDAWAINEMGQIVGSGSIAGATHAFLLTPAAVPVPGAVWLFGTGLAGLLGLTRFRGIKPHLNAPRSSSLAAGESKSCVPDD